MAGRTQLVWIETYNICEFMCLTAVDFFNHLNMLYGTITEFCTPQEVTSSYKPL